MRRGSAVLAGLAIGIVAMLVSGPARQSDIREAPSPRASPAAIPARSQIVCDQKVAVSFPNLGLEPVATAWSPDGTMLALGAGIFHRMGRYMPDEQRILLLDMANLEVRDIARGVSPAWSTDGSRLLVREPPATRDAPTSDLVVYDVRSSSEIARIANASSSLAFGWRGEDVLLWRGSELRAWRAGVETVVLDLPVVAAWRGVTVRFSGDGERAAVQSSEYSPPRGSYLLDTRAGTAERLVGAWRIEPSPRGHVMLVTYLDHRELRLEDGRTSAAEIPFTGGLIVWAPDGREPFLSPNEFVGLGNLADLEAFDGTANAATVPMLFDHAAFNATGDRYVGVRPGGRGPSSLELERCARIEPRAAPATVTVYYGESSFEPWAAKRDGSAPVGWEDLADRDLRMIGLHPIEIGRVRTLEPQILCAEPKCPNGFGLKLVIPYSERDRAYSRCFREPYPNTLAMGAAIGSFRCVPLYGPN